MNPTNYQATVNSTSYSNSAYPSNGEIPPPPQAIHYTSHPFHENLKQNLIPPQQQQQVYTTTAETTSTPLVNRQEHPYTNAGTNNWFHEKHQTDKAKNAFLIATVISFLVFFIFTPFFACIPYMFVFKYSSHEVRGARKYGQLAKSTFWSLVAFNVCLSILIVIITLAVTLPKNH
ncbi:predicted protein [Naegleria gruberi]|uniref:Predicted protein n=1 Tax=Naegleria gruberi TaxID=5762 RepID=D2VWY8_NAEGR|nr:uncharacterized protein NAEGRDRAFT_73552 [Naegleria gruberi]EFC38771.1 predicted protein [Naegleria gruberi]|eukprot:XP_002671515.1 predicted protein [Naegleria gruberi strain NEG-M]